MNFASGAGAARFTYLINEPAIIQVPRIGVRFGNRPGPPIVDQLSARDGSGADVKFNSERHDPGRRPNRRVAPDAEFNIMELEENKSYLRVSWLAHMVRELVHAYATRCDLALRFDTTMSRRGTSMPVHRRTSLGLRQARSRPQRTWRSTLPEPTYLTWPKPKHLFEIAALPHAGPATREDAT